MHHVMGVCCIVFDIHGMFEFFMNFLNIEQNKIFTFFFKYFMFFSRFMLFHNIYKKNSNIYKKNIQNIENCPFNYWLNGKWFLQIVDRDSGNLYPT